MSPPWFGYGPNFMKAAGESVIDIERVSTFYSQGVSNGVSSVTTFSITGLSKCDTDARESRHSDNGVASLISTRWNGGQGAAGSYPAVPIRRMPGLGRAFSLSVLRCFAD